MNWEHYNVPDMDKAYWWLPPPCAMPVERKYRQRFIRLVKHLITHPLKEASLPYRIRDFSVPARVGCRSLTKCWYSVTFDLGHHVHSDKAVKKARLDLQSNMPRGVQLMKAEFTEEVLHTDSDSEDELDDTCGQPHKFLVCMLCTNCEDNVRWRGNGPIRRSRIPTVDLTVA